MTAAADPTQQPTADVEPQPADDVELNPVSDQNPDSEAPAEDATDTEVGSVDEAAAVDDAPADAAAAADAAEAEADAEAEAEAEVSAVTEDVDDAVEGQIEADAETEAEAQAEVAAVADDVEAEVAAVADEADAAADEPQAVPVPRPRPVPVPRPNPGLARPAVADVEPWGRVDDDGTVSVREGDTWREVGQFPDGSPEEALAYFERKYADLASEVTLLEVRQRRGGASAADLRSAAKAVSEKITGAAAVGDLASLEARVAALTETLAAASESEAAAQREAVDEAIKARIELVEKAEALAARDPRTVQWKQASSELSALFDQWQSQQQNGPRLPKNTAQQLWKRFRDARATVDKHRREFYAELDEAHKAVRDRKAKLVERAEALAPKGEDGIAAYRELLDQWKTAGRAGKKADDALWARFKAAGDALYSARTEREAADAEASREKIAAKRALLEEAKAVADERDIAKARSLLTGIQRRWDEVGRIFPRDAERGLDDDLRKIEQGVRSREDADWKRNDPEQKARANDMTRQLTEAIEKLEDELAAAQKSGDKAATAKASEALEARKGWLRALGGGF